jgi:hypothetical protein
MKVRLQADADLNQIILLAAIRREPAIDFQTAMAASAKWPQAVRDQTAFPRNKR